LNDAVPNPLLTAALDYAARGWRVIPLYYVSSVSGSCSCKEGPKCKSAGKHPKDLGWQRAEPLSVADIHATWDTKWVPNLGLAVGQASGFWVLDIDPKNGGMETMAALVAEHGALPITFVVRTGSGGYHYYFLLPEGAELRNSADRIGKGIDTRASGGQVVAAPSVSSIGAYEIVSDAPLAQAPAWLVEAARKADVDPSTQVTTEELPRPEDIEPAEWQRLSAYAQRAIDSELGRLDKLKTEGWDGAPWNHTTFQVSCSLLEFANSPWCSYSRGQAEADVMARTPRDDGFDSYTVKKTWDSAVERIGNQARSMPVNRRTETAEVDPLFAGPDVVQQANPSGAGGAEASPAGRTYKYPYRELFGGEKGTTPLYAEMGKAVFDRGPIGWGRDLDFWSYDGGVWKSDHYVVQHRLVDILGNAYKTSHRSNTADVVQRHAQPITGEPLEQLMNFPNGMLDWRTGELVEHDPAYGSTVQLGTIWDPEAECPQFEAFLAQVMHEDYVALAWEMLGYLMLSGNPREAAFLFFGHGGNGKSTLIDLIGRLLGRENVASESLDDLNGNRFRTASLFGKIANLAGDIDATYQENTAAFKRITGEDVITAEHKNMPPFKFQSWAVPVFSANKFPGSADLTEGYFRRWIVLHFHKRIPKDKIVDRGVLMERLERELPGIAAKAVAALRVLDERGRFEPTGEAVKGKEMYMLEIDAVRQWLASADVMAKPEGWTNIVTLYQAYSAWATRAGHRNPVREQEFQSRLENVGLETRTMAGFTEVAGISAVLINQRATTPDNFL
jgi:putative DNA primase/helicase